MASHQELCHLMQMIFTDVAHAVMDTSSESTELVVALKLSFCTTDQAPFHSIQYRISSEMMCIYIYIYIYIIKRAKKERERERGGKKRKRERRYDEMKECGERSVCVCVCVCVCMGDR